MSSIFSTLARFFQQKYTKPLIGFGLIIFMGVCFGESGTGPQYETADLTKNIIEIFDLLFGLLALILGPMVVLAGWLLSPDWTMGDFFGLRAYFKEVWILVANIVYIIFALMLLYMAIMQIFGVGENDYAFKKRLGPFLVGILIVPFTWLIVSWTLSFANQAVAAVLSIPMGAIGKLDTGGIPGKQNLSQWHRKVLPTQFDFSDSKSGYGPGVKCEGGKLSNNANIDCISPAEFLAENQAGPFFIIMIYAYNIFKIQEADITKLETLCTGKESKSSDAQYKAAKTCVEDLMGIIRNFGLSLIITVFFAIMLIALCWILLMRAIKLWIYVMLSPLFGLAYFTGKGFGESVGSEGESGFGQVGFKSFFKLAMVPVLVSAVLAFGLLFVGVVRDNFNGAKDPNQKEFCTEQNVGYMVTYCITEQTEGSKKVYTSKLIIGTDTNLSNGDAKITLNFGDSFSKIISTSEASSVASGAVSGGISSVEDIFAHIILTMLALVFMFMGVKAAANFDPVTEAAFKPFAKLGESVGNFVAHSPSYLPLPHPAFAALTPAGISAAATTLTNKVTREQAQFGKSMEQMFKDPGSAALLNAAQDMGDSAEKIANVTERFMDQGKNYFETPHGTEVGARALVAKINSLQESVGLTPVERDRVYKFKSLAGKSDVTSAEIREALNENEVIFDKFRSKGDVDFNNLMKRILSTESAKKMIDGKELDVQKNNNNYTFNLGGTKAFEISKVGTLVGSSLITSTQKAGLQELFRKGLPQGYSDTLNPSELDLGLQNIIDISGLTPDQKKQIAVTLLK